MYILRTHPGDSCHGVHFKYYILVSLTSKYNYHLRKAIPLREHFLTVKETVKENVPVDTDSGIHNMRLLLMFSCKWCTCSE